MKKNILTILILIVVAFLGYFLVLKFYTKKIDIVKEVSSPEDCVRRHFLNTSLLEKSLGIKMYRDSIFVIENCTFIITKKMLNGFQIKMVNDKDTLHVFFSLTSAQNDKKSILGFASAEKVNNKSIFVKAASRLLLNAENFFNDEEKVYGFKTKIERTTDFFLLSLKKTTSRKPSTEEVYNLISVLENYIKLNQGKIKNPPMLNVFEEQPNMFTTMVAIPTTNQVQGVGDIYFKQLVDGNLLTAMVKGGPFKVEQAEAQLKTYLLEYKKSSPAIPYQTLITNRMQESDTNKWVTKLNYPVFY